MLPTNDSVSNGASTYEELRSAVLENKLEAVKQVFIDNDEETCKEVLEIQDDQHGETIFLQACRSRTVNSSMLALLFSQIRHIGHHELLKQHLSRRSNDNGFTAIMLITRYSPKHEMIEEFLESIVFHFGEDVLKEHLDSRTTNGDTPLALACKNESITTETVLLLSSWLAHFGLCDRQYENIQHFGAKKRIRKTSEEIDEAHTPHHHQSELDMRAEIDALEKVAEANDLAEIKKIFQRSGNPRKLVDDTVSCYEKSRGILMQALARGASENTVAVLVKEITKVGGVESLKKHLLHKDDHQWTSLMYAAHFCPAINPFKLFADKIEQVCGGSVSSSAVLDTILNAQTDKGEYLLQVALSKKSMVSTAAAERNNRTREELSFEWMFYLASVLISHKYTDTTPWRQTENLWRLQYEKSSASRKAYLKKEFFIDKSWRPEEGEFIPIRKAICENDHISIKKILLDREKAKELLEKRRDSASDDDHRRTVLEQAIEDQPGIKMGEGDDNNEKLPVVSIDTFELLFDEFERIAIGIFSIITFPEVLFRIF